jgi:hypothetical protein
MSKNEVIELPVKSEAQNLPVTREAVEKLRAQRALLKEYVQSQLRKEVDYGTVPGTPKPTLYKPGAEKLAQLFGLGVEVMLSDRIIEREGNFAMFTYRAKIYPLRSPEFVIATCEGSCNSQEKKYAKRKKYKKVPMPRQDGTFYEKRVEDGEEDTPVTDVLNTLIKMAQKRAYVGAVILATGASDFFTQDIDDPEDAAAIGVNQRPEPARAKVTIPTVTATASQNQTQQQAAPSGAPNCEVCGSGMQLTRNRDAWNCPNWKDQAAGRHSYFKLEGA